MSLIQKLAIAYALMFFAVVAIGYVPAFNDADGNLFGLFSLQWYDDLLHAFSGVWALAAAFISHRQAVLLFQAVRLGLSVRRRARPGHRLRLPRCRHLHQRLPLVRRHRVPDPLLRQRPASGDRRLRGVRRLLAVEAGRPKSWPWPEPKPMFLVRLIKRLIKALVILVVIVVLIPIAGLAYGFLTTDAIDTAPLAGIADGAPPAAVGGAGAGPDPGLPAAGGIDLPHLSRMGDRLCGARICRLRQGSPAERLSLLVLHRPLLAGLRDGDPRQLGLSVQFREPPDAGRDRHQPHHRACDPVGLREHRRPDHRSDRRRPHGSRRLPGAGRRRLCRLPRPGAVVPVSLRREAGRADGAGARRPATIRSAPPSANGRSASPIRSSRAMPTSSSRRSPRRPIRPCSTSMSGPRGRSPKPPATNPTPRSSAT